MTMLGTIWLLDLLDSHTRKPVSCDLVGLSDRRLKQLSRRFRGMWTDPVSITVANTVKDANAQVTNGIAGETITAGASIYTDTTTTPNKMKLTDADQTLKYSSAGIALHGALLNQPIAYQTSGDIIIGGTLVVGEIYCVSGVTAGGICTSAEAHTHNTSAAGYTAILGIAITTTILRLNLFTGDVLLT